MMNSTNDDEFGANPFRTSDGMTDIFAPVPANTENQQQEQHQQHQQFSQPPPLQQQFALPAPQQQQHAFAQPVPQQQPAFAQPVPQQQPAFAQPVPQQQQFSQPPPIQQHQQQFPPQQAPVNSGLPTGLMTPAPMQQQQQSLPAQQAPTSWWGSCMACLTMDSYKIYFDIDADDIVRRMRGVFYTFYKPEHFRNNIMGSTKTNELKGPDLYGPFWITMTLIFFIGVTANLHGYVHRNEVDEFDYDINHLLHAASILVSFSFGLPTILWMTTTCCMSMNALQLVEWICLYGYSLVPYLPAVVLSVIPVSIIAWVTLAAATTVSCLLVIRNVAPVLMGSDTGNGGVGGPAKGPPIVLAMLGCHVVFFLVLKFTFYHFTPSKHNNHAAGYPTMAPVASAPYAAPAEAPFAPPTA